MKTAPSAGGRLNAGGDVAWLKQSICGGRNVKLEVEVRDVLLRYSKHPGKKVIKGV